MRGTLESNGLSSEHCAKGRLQRELLARLDVHERDEMLPTSARFLFYELVQAGVVPKTATGARRADQNTIDALTHLREHGLVPVGLDRRRNPLSQPVCDLTDRGRLRG